MSKFGRIIVLGGIAVILIAAGIYLYYFADRGFDVAEQPRGAISPEATVFMEKIQNSVDEIISGITAEGIGSASLSPNSPLPRKILLQVPFTTQAPFGNWADARQDYGCEEAAILMAMYWVYGKDLPPEEAEKEIIAISDFEQEKYGDFHDTSTLDTLKVLKEYFGYENVFAKFDIGIDDIKAELAQGNLVIVPIDGTKVNNPYYTPPGPAKHKIVIRGYDDSSQEFITNDPGTKRGDGYQYNYQILENAIVDYPSGLNEPVNQIRAVMMVVKK